MPNWIAAATSKNKGKLRKKLGAKKGQNISSSKLNKATHSKNPKTRKEAVLAKTLKKINRRRK